MKQIRYQKQLLKKMLLMDLAVLVFLCTAAVTTFAQDEILNDAAVVDQSGSDEAPAIESADESNSVNMTLGEGDAATSELETPPKIYGQKNLLLPTGYAATSTYKYGIEGDPRPTVTLNDRDNSNITWNDTAETLDIPAGLAAGDYKVELTAHNGLQNEDGTVLDAKFYFTLYVRDLSIGGTPPAFTGQWDPINYLREGYAAISIGPYEFTGEPEPIISIESDDSEKITWNNTAKTLNIAAGLGKGAYNVTLAANNEYGTAVLRWQVDVLAADDPQPPPSTGGGPGDATIAGPTTMTLQEGYAATSTGEYTINGYSTIAIIDEDHSNIKWNGVTQTLVIPAGLGVGVYNVELIANSGYDNAKLEFTLYVKRTSSTDEGSGGGPGGGSGSGQSDSNGRKIISKITTVDHFERTSYISESKIKTAIQITEKSGSTAVKTKAAYSEGHMLVKPKDLNLMKGYSYIHDTTRSSVQVRVQIPEPEKVQSDLYICGSVTGKEVDYINAIFEKRCTNNIRVVHLHQQSSWGQTVNLAARVEFSDMNTDNLYFYSYDQKMDKYQEFKTNYQIDDNGYIHFSSSLAGGIIISDGMLSEGLQAQQTSIVADTYKSNDTSGTNNGSTSGAHTQAIVKLPDSGQASEMLLLFYAGTLLMAALCFWRKFRKTTQDQ